MVLDVVVDFCVLCNTKIRERERDEIVDVKELLFNSSGREKEDEEGKQTK